MMMMIMVVVVVVCTVSDNYDIFLYYTHSKLRELDSGLDGTMIQKLIIYTNENLYCFRSLQ